MTDWQEWEVPFSGTLETKTDQRQLRPPNFIALENAEFDTRGAITQANGLDPVGSGVYGGGFLASVSALASHNNEVLVFDDSRGYSRLATKNAWIQKGNIDFIDTSVTQINSPDGIARGGTASYVNGLTVYAGIRNISGANANAFVTITDTATGATVLDAQDLGTVLNTGMRTPLKSIVLEESVMIAVPTATGQIAIWRVNTNLQSPSASLATVLPGFVNTTSDAFTTSGAWDMAALTATDGYISYRVSAVSIRTSLVTVNGISTVTTTTLATASDGVVAVATQASPARVFVTYSTTAGIRAITYTAALAISTADTLINTFPAPPNGPVNRMATINVGTGTYTIFYDLNLAATPASPAGLNIVRTQVRKLDVTDTGTFATIDNAFTVGLRLGSKIFTHRGFQYIVLLFNHSKTLTGGFASALTKDGASLLCRTFFSPTVNTSTLTVVSKTDVGFQPVSDIGDVAIISSGLFECAGTKLVLLDPVDKYGLKITRYNFQTKKGVIDKKFSTNTMLCASQLWEYDGSQIFESGFNYYPSYDIGFVSTGGSISFVSGNVLQFAVIYSWVDDNGNIHRSGFFPVSYTASSAGGANRFLIEAPMLLTSRQNVSIDVYMSSAANSSILKYVTSAENSPSSGPAFFNVTAYPAATAANLYTTGGVIANGIIPSPDTIQEHNGRLHAIINGRDLWYSKKTVVGEGLGMSAAQSFPLPSDSGKAVSLESLDDNLLIGKETSSYLLGGEGPNVLGIGAFTGPQKVLVDIGTDIQSPASAVKTDQGVIFKSSKGFYILKRDFSAHELVELTQYNNHNVLAADLLGHKKQVRMILSPKSGLSGNTTVIYDYAEGRFSILNGGFQDQIASTAFDSVYWLGRSVGFIYMENNRHNDLASNVVMTVTTGWINLAGIQGYQRIRRYGIVGENINGTLRVQTNYDYTYSGLGQSQIDTFTTSGTGINTYRQRLHRQRCQAISFTITVNSDNPTVPARLSSIILELGIVPGIYRRSIR